MRVIGLTGGIGAGKSTVAEMLAAHGAVVIDVDELGREVIDAHGEAVDDVVARFGEQVRASDGGIDRAALASIVFGNPDELAALNAISHPAIDRLLERRLHDIDDTSPHAIVVLDMAVLTETTLGRNIAHPYELVIVVEADRNTRVARLAERGLTRSDAEARMASQANDADRRAIADYVISNNGDLIELANAVTDLWTRLEKA